MTNMQVSRRRLLDLEPRLTHHTPRAKTVIQFVLYGGPSQMDLFDIHQPHNANVLMGSPFQFRKAGQSGIEISEALPRSATVADDLCMIRSIYSEHNNDPEGLNQLQTCRIFPGRPVLGSWISFALGSVNQNLPAFIVLRDPEG